MASTPYQCKPTHRHYDPERERERERERGGREGEGLVQARCKVKLAQHSRSSNLY